MARALFSHERNDPDVEWLISNYLEDRTDLELLDIAGLPLVILLSQNNDILEDSSETVVDYEANERFENSESSN